MLPTGKRTDHYGMAGPEFVHTQAGSVLLALGANTAGRWGSPAESMIRARRELEAAGVVVKRASRLYVTEPVGGGLQPPYVNAVLVVAASLAPGGLLRLVKRIEHRAGRRLAPPMRARPLDIDILDHGGRRVAWPVRGRERGRLILPHPHLHSRTFVLVPLSEAAPAWRHPVLGRRAKALLERLRPNARSGVRQALDLVASPCDKARALRPRFGSVGPGRIWRSALNITRGMAAWRV